MLQIPTFQHKGANFDQEIILGNRVLDLKIAWNSRSEYWYLSVLDKESEELLSSIKIVQNWALLRQYKSSVPDIPGDFIVLKEDQEIGDFITYDNLNAGYNLYYLTAEEAEEWEDDNGVG